MAGQGQPLAAKGECCSEFAGGGGALLRIATATRRGCFSLLVGVVGVVVAAALAYQLSATAMYRASTAEPAAEAGAAEPAHASKRTVSAEAIPPLSAKKKPKDVVKANSSRTVGNIASPQTMAQLVRMLLGCMMAGPVKAATGYEGFEVFFGMIFIQQCVCIMIVTLAVFTALLYRWKCFWFQVPYVAKAAAQHGPGGSASPSGGFHQQWEEVRDSTQQTDYTFKYWYVSPVIRSEPGHGGATQGSTRRILR